MSTQITSAEELAQLPDGSTLVVLADDGGLRTYVKQDNGLQWVGEGSSGGTAPLAAFTPTVERNRVWIDGPARLGDYYYEGNLTADVFYCMEASHGGRTRWVQMHGALVKGFVPIPVGRKVREGDVGASTRQAVKAAVKGYRAELDSERLAEILATGTVPPVRQVTAQVEVMGKTETTVPITVLAKLLEKGLEPTDEITTTVPWSKTVALTYDSHFGCDCGAITEEMVLEQVTGSIDSWSVVGCDA